MPPLGDGNIASLVLRHAAAAPDRPAIVLPDGPALTYGALAARIGQFRGGLAAAGVGPGDRMVLLFPVGGDFYALALACFAAGAAVVLLDGRLGLGRIAGVLAVARPRAVASVRALLRLWPVLPALWGTERFAAEGGGVGYSPIARLAVSPGVPGAIARSPDDPALITFTSGSTGRPKGADRTHGLLIAQHRALRAKFPDAPGEVDMPCFPAVVLHNLCCGITSVVPPMDLRAPASVDPARILAAAAKHQVTSMSGAPAYWTRIVEYIEGAGTPPTTVRRLAVGGAPVSRRLCARLVKALPLAEAWAVYGSTEAEPIAAVRAAEAAEAKGDGFLAGRIADVADVALVRLPEPAPRLDERGLDPWRVAPGEAGEVVVRGPHVNRRYIGDEAANREVKLPMPDGTVWHRTGDVARRDGEGRLWLLGRLGDRVGERDPYPLEADLLALEGVVAAAWVATGRAPAGEVAVELAPGANGAAAEVRAAVARRAGAGGAGAGVRVVERIPMDARHQSKVDRKALREMLA